MKRIEYVVYTGKLGYECHCALAYESKEKAESILIKYGYIFDADAGMYLNKKTKMWSKIKEVEV